MATQATATKNTTKLDSQFSELLQLLHRGGAFGYYWKSAGKVSTWWRVGAPSPIPDPVNVYFGIHPTAVARARSQRSTNDTVCAINCLFAEFDAKDFGGDLAACLAHINTLTPAPSVVICSGGGYHCYWLLRETFALASDANRQRARQLQAAWVKRVGSDPDAKDLSRVLRVPGTLNAKYEPARRVQFERCDLAQLYDLAQLAALVDVAQAWLPDGYRGPALWSNNSADHLVTVTGLAGTTNGIRFFKIEGSATAVPESELAPAKSNGIHVEQHTEDEAHRSAYAKAGLAKEIKRIDDATAGERHKAINRAAFSVGQLIGAGALDEADAVAQLEAAADRAYHGDKTKGAAHTISDGIKAGKAKPRVMPAHHGNYALTDLGNGQRFADQHAEELRFVGKEWGWLVWDRCRYQRDNAGATERAAKTTSLSIFDDTAPWEAKEKAAADELETAAGAKDEAGVKLAKKNIADARQGVDRVRRWAIASQAHNRREAMILDASSEPVLLARPAEFDTDPLLLNCKNGTVDLRTGTLLPNDQADLITHLVPVDYDAGAPCPTWLKFLNKIFDGEQIMIDFLRRAVGYSLTGLDDEQCLFFLYGVGMNGKSKFIGALEDMFGDYAAKTRAETLLAKSKYQGDSSSNDVAALAGARLVVAAELPKNRQLNESLIKDLTGSDTMSARFLYHEAFKFKTQFKLWIYGNNKPRIVGTDEGIWRRIKLIPFDVVIPKGERDTRLGAKLRAELPGILAWAVAGCLEWQLRLETTPGNALGYPVKVEQATAAYRAEEDEVGKFISECCTLNATAAVTSAALFDRYEKWGGELKAQPFGKELSARGFQRDRGTNGARTWKGLTII